MRNEKSRIEPIAPLLIPTISFASGIYLCCQACHKWDVPSWVLILISALLLLISGFSFILISRQQSPHRIIRLRKIYAILVSSGFFAGGIFIFALNAPTKLPQETVKELHHAIGWVRGKTTTNAGDILEVEVHTLVDERNERIPIRNMKVTLRSDASESTIDDLIVFPAHFVENDDPANSFSQGQSMLKLFKGERYSIRASGADIHTFGQKKSFIGTATKLRARIERYFELSVLNTATKHFLITLLLGNREYLHPEIRNLFSSTGLAHIIALSGLHIAIISGFILILLFPINLTGHYKLRITLATIILFFYGMMTGWNYSTVRSLIMMACITAGFILQRKNSAWNSLLLSALVILAIWPQALFDIGFILSFTCVASLIFFVDPLNPFDHRNHPIAFKVATVFLVTIITTFSTWTIAGCCFGALPLPFLLTNIVILPLLPAYVVIAIFSLVLAEVPLLGHALIQVTNLGYDGLVSFLSFLGDPEDLSLKIEVSEVSCILWAIALILWGMYFHGAKRRIVGMGAAILGCITIASVAFPGMANPDYKDKELLICNYHYKVTAKIKKGPKIESIDMPSSAISYLSTANGTIAHLGTTPSEESSPSKNIDWLIVSRGCKTSPKELLRQGFLTPNTMLLIHPMVTRETERIFTTQADSLGIRVHSLRKSPFRTEL